MEKRAANGKFLPGHCGGPGRKKGSITEMARLARESKEELVKATHKYITMPVKEVVEVSKKVKDQNTEVPMIEALIISVIARATKHGDIRGVEYLFNQVMGRPKETIDLSATADMGDHFEKQREEIQGIIDEIKQEGKEVENITK